MTDYVRAVERAYVAAATGAPPPPRVDGDPLAAIGAVASHYLAVGTPRTLGLVGDDAALAAASVAAHGTWFQPRELRCAGAQVAGAREVSLAEALASDIVCVHMPLALRADQLRRGTHVNLLAGGTLDDDLQQLAVTYREAEHLGALAAGLIDGRQLDEITVFVIGDAAIARATCSPSPDPR